MGRRNSTSWLGVAIAMPPPQATTYPGVPTDSKGRRAAGSALPVMVIGVIPASGSLATTRQVRSET